MTIYPNEIERVLPTHPAMSEAAAVAWPPAEFGEEVAVLEPKVLRQHCPASHDVPRTVFEGGDPEEQRRHGTEAGAGATPGRAMIQPHPSRESPLP